MRIITNNKINKQVICFQEIIFKINHNKNNKVKWILAYLIIQAIYLET